jgi:phage terminase large subunit-like protein
VKVQRYKVSRMAVVSNKFEAGQVFFPEQATWLADLEAEVFAFPGGRHDDQCDSVSQALSETAVRFQMRISPETIALMSRPVPGARVNSFGFGPGRKW